MTHSATSNTTIVEQNAIINELRKRAALSRFTIYVLIAISLYNIAEEFVDDNIFLKNLPHTYFTCTVLSLITIFAFIMMRKLNLPLSKFGLTLKNLKRHTIESLTWTFFVCLLLLLLKWILITQISAFSSLRLFDITHTLSATSITIPYFIFSFVQVFITQGALQSSLLELLEVPNATAISVFVTTVIFSSIHIDLNMAFALAVIPLSIFWCILYNKQRNIISIGLSHAIIGVWALWVLNYIECLKIFSQHYLS